jgi:hypothetical protein
MFAQRFEFITESTEVDNALHPSASGRGSEILSLVELTLNPILPLANGVDQVDRDADSLHRLGEVIVD